MSGSGLGSRGERAAARWLAARGYAEEARNYRTRFGEIDIVVRDGNTVVFVEVKTRASARAGPGRESVTRRKRDALIKAAYLYLRERALEDAPFRFDVIEVGASSGGFTYDHIPNAFGGDGF